jgi:hypothetical protein
MSDAFRTPYPDYDVLAKRASPSWDEVTRTVVEARLHEPQAPRFFTQHDWLTLLSICDRIVPQPERARPIPIAPWIDDKLARDESEGYRYAGLPPARDAWRLGLRGIDEHSLARRQRAFIDLAQGEQDLVLHEVGDGDVSGTSWQHVPAARFFESMLVRDIVSFYYAHPSAWSELGFGGPASPRGYVRLGADQRDPWEARLARKLDPSR